MVAESTHPSLLCRVRDPNDQQAWREFEARYARLLLRYAQGRGLQRMDAEDVRQLVLLKLANALRSFQYDPGRGRFRDYLGRVVRNAIHTQAARPMRPSGAVGVSEAAGVAGEDDAGDAVWDREWMLHHFHMAMRTVRVTFDQKSLEIFDRILAGEAPDLVAQEFGVTRDAVYKVKQRIRERLKELVRQQIDDEELEGPEGGR
jgi:RNA polymerase sigma-70 factor (ECF subfamily)